MIFRTLKLISIFRKKINRLQIATMSRTRMHSSRMRTACSGGRLGGLHQAPPWSRPPRSRLPWTRHPPGADPPGPGTPQSRPSWEQTPSLGAGIPHCKACWDSTHPRCKACWDTTCNACWDSTHPPAARHAEIPPAMHAGIAHTPCCKACWDTTCNACWDTNPLWTEWQTGVKILPCPKLHLRAVNIEASLKVGEVWLCFLIFSNKAPNFRRQMSRKQKGRFSQILTKTSATRIVFCLWNRNI